MAVTMSETILDTTEERILQTARQIFEKKGYDGTSMQEIADAAKINKAMLHYYYRSKDKLFDRVFQLTFAGFLDCVGSVFESNLAYLDKIREFISIHADFLIDNQHIPSFIIHEINRNPARIAELLRLNRDDKRFVRFFKETAAEIESGRIRNIDARQLLVNILALNIFPVAARPILATMLELEEEGYRQFLITRKASVFNLIKDLLEVK